MTEHPFRSAPSARPDVLICSGLDPSGGAGFIADVRVVGELGCRPVGVVTALTVQNTTGATSAEATNPEVVREQLEFLLSDVEVKAVKIGVVGSNDVAKAIAGALALTGAPVVWDPIIRPTLGPIQYLDRMFAYSIEALQPHVSLLTPNSIEVRFLSDLAVTSMDEAIAAGERVSRMMRCAVLVKGGHLGGDESIDVLCHAGRREELKGPRTPGGEDVHGTGCALSSAIAAYLALGAELVEACRAAKVYVAARIAAPARPGRGAAAIV